MPVRTLARHVSLAVHQVVRAVVHAVLPAAVLVAVPVTLMGVSACRGSSENNAAGAAPSMSIQNKGSDTLLQLAQAWAEAYRDERADVSIAVTGGGSGTGIASLMNGTADIANASRPMKPAEFDEAEKNGIRAEEHVVAIDALAVIVHLSNPVDRLTIEQLSDIYSGRVTNWSEVGGNDAGIILVSRETNSGTHVYFLEEVVRQGDSDRDDIFAAQTLLMPSSVGITSEIQRNPNAIGYDGLGYVTDEEKMIAVADTAEDPYVLPSVESAANDTYPLSRPLFMYAEEEPGSVIDEYLAWILGAPGQRIVARLGFVPVAAGNRADVDEG